MASTTERTKQTTSLPRRATGWLLLVSLCLWIPATAQLPDSPFPSDSNVPILMRQKTSPYDLPLDPLSESRRLKKLNELRQKSMVADAAKLLRLAHELNDAVAAGESGSMSAQERLRRAGEIEKLAKDVKSKMIYAMSAAPDPNYASPRMR